MNSKLLGGLSLLVIVLYLSPFFIGGEHTHITVADNLDSMLVNLKVLVESGKIFAAPAATIDNAMNGAPRASYPSELSLIVCFFYFLGPFWGYVLNDALIRLLALLGMFLLLQKHVLPQNDDKPIIFGASLTFALLPYFSLFGLSVAGIPLALYAFLNIRRYTYKVHDWVIICLMPFYSSLILSFAFFLFAMASVWFYDIAWGRRLNRPFFVAIATMAIVFLIVEYRLVLSLISPSAGFASHREEFNALVTYSLHDALQLVWFDFFFGLGHAASLHRWAILPTVFAAALLALWRKIEIRLFWPLVLVLVAIAFVYGFFVLFLQAVKTVYPNIPVVNLGRFYFLQPALWYILFGIALHTLWRHARFGRVVVAMVLAAQVSYLFYRSEHFTERRLGYPDYAEVFSTNLFSEIAAYIGSPKESYRVVSIGLHPSIAQFNGFFTLDAYHTVYPLAYKHRFRGLIAGELKKSAWAETYFDRWGSRAYVMSSELEKYPPLFMVTSERASKENIRINQLAFNAALFKEMGGRYVFSAVEVGNAEKIGLHLLKVFRRNDSPWQIYLYQPT